MSGFHFSLNDFTLAWLSLLFEGLPFVLVGTLISGLIDAFVPAEVFTRRVPRRLFVAVALAALGGLVLPMCECGVVPVLRRLLRKGLPLSCAVAYLLAAPIVNPLVALSTAAAFKNQGALEMTVLRLGLGWVIAVGAGLLISRLRQERVLREGVVAELLPGAVKLGSARQSGAPKRTVKERCVQGVQCAVHDFMETAFYLVVGSALAAVFSTGVQREILTPLLTSNAASTAVMMLGAVLLCLCSTSDAFVAASLTQFPPVAKLAFLVYGPMIDLKLLAMYSMVFRKRFTVLLALGLALVVFVLSLGVGALVWK